jgi:hypothetical protein
VKLYGGKIRNIFRFIEISIDPFPAFLAPPKRFAKAMRGTSPYQGEELDISEFKFDKYYKTTLIKSGDYA